jgi:hypothetical protein
MWCEFAGWGILGKEIGTKREGIGNNWRGIESWGISAVSAGGVETRAWRPHGVITHQRAAAPHAQLCWPQHTRPGRRWSAVPQSTQR